MKKLPERIKNPSEDSIVGSAMNAGKKAVAFAQEKSKQRGERQLLGALDFIDKTSKELQEGQFKFLADLYKVEHLDTATVITKKRRFIGGVMEEVAPNVYTAHQEALWNISEVTIERNEDGNVARILMSDINTPTLGVEHRDFELEEQPEPDLICPLPESDQTEMPRQIRVIYSHVANAQLSQQEYLSRHPS